MAIHDLWSYDNAPVGMSLLSGTTDLTRVTNSSNIYAYYTGNLGMVFVAAASSTCVVTSDGFLTFGRTSSGLSNGILFNLNQVFSFGGSVTKWAMGFRTKSNVAVATNSPGRIIATAASFSSALAQTFVTEADLAAPTNTELYVELIFDSVALTYTLYINGVVIRTASCPASAFASGFVCGIDTFGTASIANSARGYRDFYFLDIDSTDLARLGPIRSSPATLSNVLGSEWLLNSAADLPTALTTALQNPPLTTPSASAPADFQHITANLNTSISSGTSIIAVQPAITMLGDAATNQIDLSLSQGSQTVDLGKLTAPLSANLFNQRWGIQRTAPDGGVWTPAKVNATQATLTPSGVPATLLLMHMDGANNGQSFPDVKGHTTGVVGNSITSTAQSRFGGASFTVVDTNSYAYVNDASDLHLSGEWTIEFWMNPNNITQDTQVLDKSQGARTDFTTRAWIEQNGAGIMVKVDGTSSASAIGSGYLVAGVWQHIAIVSHNGVITVYWNGVSVGTLSSTASWGNNTGRLGIGNNSFANNSQFAGYLDELRISSVARYLSTFTPPDSAFGSDSVALASVFSSTQLTATVSPKAATTTTALLGSIMADAGINLVPEDIVSTSVAAGASTVTLTATSTSVNYRPGSTVTLTFTAAPVKTILLMHLDSNLAEIATGTTLTTGGTITYPPGEIGQAANFSSSGYFTIPASIIPAQSLLKSGVSTTVEYWLYLTAAPTYSQPSGIGDQAPTASTNYWTFGPNPSRQLQLYTFNGTTGYRITSTALIPLNQWNHLALVCDGTNVTLYLNGTAVASGAVMFPTGTTGTVSVGRTASGTLPGMMDELRISKVARYTGTFTPQASPFLLD